MTVSGRQGRRPPPYSFQQYCSVNDLRFAVAKLREFIPREYPIEIFKNGNWFQSATDVRRGRAEGLDPWSRVSRTCQQFLQMVSIAFFIRASSATLWSCNDFAVELS
jgi:hypothetical protein